MNGFEALDRIGGLEVEVRALSVAIAKLDGDRDFQGDLFALMEMRDRKREEIVELRDRLRTVSV